MLLVHSFHFNLAELIFVKQISIQLKDKNIRQKYLCVKFTLANTCGTPFSFKSLIVEVIFIDEQPKHNAINKQQIGKKMPKYWFVISL